MLYRHVLGRDDFDFKVPAKRSRRLPQPLGRTEISRLFDAARNPKHRAILMTAYAGGLRVSELAQHLENLHDPIRRRRLLETLRGKPWVVDSKRPFAGPRKLVDYLGRYTHRAAISNNSRKIPAAHRSCLSG